MSSQLSQQRVKKTQLVSTECAWHVGEMVHYSEANPMVANLATLPLTPNTQATGAIMLRTGMIGV